MTTTSRCFEEQNTNRGVEENLNCRGFAVNKVTLFENAQQNIQSPATFNLAINIMNTNPELSKGATGGLSAIDQKLITCTPGKWSFVHFWVCDFLKFYKSMSRAC